MIVMLANGFSIRPARPRARGLKRFNTRSLPTQAWATTRSSTSRSWLFSALAIADSSVFLTSTEIGLFENSRSASARAAGLLAWASDLGPLGLLVGGMAVKGAGRREFAEIVADHLFRHQHRNVL